MPVRTRSLGQCSCLKARSDPCRRSVCCPLHTGVLCLPFQHPFVSKVTSNRALRELVAEAKAEVMEEIEDSRDEAEDDDSSESASVSTALPALRQALPPTEWGCTGGKSPQPGSQRMLRGYIPQTPMGEGCCFVRPHWWTGKQFLGQGAAMLQWLPRAQGNNGAGGRPGCLLAGGVCPELLLWARLCYVRRMESLGFHRAAFLLHPSCQAVLSARGLGWPVSALSTPGSGLCPAAVVWVGGWQVAGFLREVILEKGSDKS